MMTSLHVSKDGRQLLDLVDNLRNIPDIEKDIPLPQIVVVGQQSSGKSSVLNAISGVTFPTDDGLCTQFPTEIILRREETVANYARLHLNRDYREASEPFKKSVEAFEQRWFSFDLKQLKEIILDAKTLFGIDGQKHFSFDTLVLEICGPTQDHLTLIDLPGYFVSTQVGQHESDIGLVNKIADHYMHKKHATILAIVSGKNDFENQSILEILKVDDGLRGRTLGVITAPDAIELGSRRERDCIDLIKVDPRGLGHHWHVIRNLGHIEASAGTFDRDDVERRFFCENKPWNELDKAQLGSDALKKKLSTILRSSIAQCLPGIQKEVQQKLERTDRMLAALGEDREKPHDLRRFLWDRAQAFEREMGCMLNGTSSSTSDDLLGHCCTLRASVESRYTDFAREMHQGARLWSLDPERGVTQAERLKLIYAGTVPGTTVVQHRAMGDLLGEKIARNRGKALPNTLDPRWTAKYFRQQSARWEEIAQAHTRTIVADVGRYVRRAVSQIADEEIAARLLAYVVEPAVVARKSILEAKLVELRRPYTLTEIHCFSRRFHEEAERICKSPRDNVEDMMRSAEAYYNICIEIFIQNVIDLGIEHCLLDGLSTILIDHVHSLAGDEDFERLGGESDAIKDMRRKLLLERARFGSAQAYLLQEAKSQPLRLDPKVNGSFLSAGWSSSFKSPTVKSSPLHSERVMNGSFNFGTPSRTSLQAAAGAAGGSKVRIHSPGRASLRVNGTVNSTTPNIVPTSSPSPSIFSHPADSKSVSSATSVDGSPAARITDKVDFNSDEFEFTFSKFLDPKTSQKPPSKGGESGATRSNVSGNGESGTIGDGLFGPQKPAT